MLRLMLALVLSFTAVLVAGPKFLPFLKRLNFGQTIYALGPETHKTKQGTPIMGGLMFAASTTAVTLALHGTWHGVWDLGLAAMALSLLSMSVGLADDWVKAVKKRSQGLTPWQKIAGQVLSAAAFACYCYFNPLVGSAVYVPFVQTTWDLGVWYIPLMTLVVVFIVNSANLQDGLDGLLSGVTSVGGAAWGLIALFMSLAVTEATGGAPLSGGYMSLSVFALALTGGCMGFLRFNRYPAMVFMGDSGSMFIGGATAALALLLRQPFLLLLIAFTMCMSSVSVMMQVAYFKLTHGKRIFKMSPIHHHFELCGHTETQIDAMYAVVTGVLSLIALLSVQGLPLF